MSLKEKNSKKKGDSDESSSDSSSSSKKKLLRKRRRSVKKLCYQVVIGYTLGIILTAASFIVMINVYKFSLMKSVWLCAFIGVISTLGFSFSKSFKCNIVLIIPMVCSVKGRSFLVAYALLLTASGPFFNIVKNVQVLGKSLSCGQEQLKEALKKILEIIKTPFIAIKNAIQMALAELKRILKQIEKIFQKVVKLLKKILDTIKSVFSWLGGRTAICDKELGNPFERCIKKASETMSDCEAAMQFLKPLCHVTKVFNGLCYTLKLFDVFCDFQIFVSDAIVKKVIERIKHFQESLRNIFDASVKFDHEFHFVSNQSKNWSEVGSDIMKDVRDQFSFTVLFGWAEFVTAFLFFRLYLKAMYYKHKYMKSIRFDNHFVTKQFVHVDNQRKKMGKELALPLTRKEKKRYVLITSITLVRKELIKMSRSVMFLLITTVQITCTCLIDYSLFSVLDMMRQVGMKEEPLQSPKFLGVGVAGAGFLADIYKGVINSFEPLAAKFDLNPKPCLPRPKKTNYKRYYQIGTVLFFCWMFLLIEPYVLRLRQVVMSNFYPERTQERAVWLYNQVLLKRSSFIKLARRQARRKILKDGTQERFSWKEWIRAKTNKWFIFRKMFGTGKATYCILCATYLTPKSMVKCETPLCKGMYCAECFRESENICCLCKTPIEYGDASDISEEIDSDELNEVKVNKYCP